MNPVPLLVAILLIKEMFPETETILLLQYAMIAVSCIPVKVVLPATVMLLLTAISLSVQGSPDIPTVAPSGNTLQCVSKFVNFFTDALIDPPGPPPADSTYCVEILDNNIILGELQFPLAKRDIPKIRTLSMFESLTSIQTNVVLQILMYVVISISSKPLM